MPAASQFPTILDDGALETRKIARFHVKGKGSPYSITERRVQELIQVLGSQPAGDVNHKPGGRLLLLSARPAVTPQPLIGLLPVLLLGEQRHNVCLRLLPDRVATAI